MLHTFLFLLLVVRWSPMCRYAPVSVWQCRRTRQHHCRHHRTECSRWSILFGRVLCQNGRRKTLQTTNHTKGCYQSDCRTWTTVLSSVWSDPTTSLSSTISQGTAVCPKYGTQTIGQRRVLCASGCTLEFSKELGCTGQSRLEKDQQRICRSESRPGQTVGWNRTRGRRNERNGSSKTVQSTIPRQWCSCKFVQQFHSIWGYYHTLKIIVFVSHSYHVFVLQNYIAPADGTAVDLETPLLSLTWSSAFSFAKCHLEESAPYDSYSPYIMGAEQFPRYARYEASFWVLTHY